MKKKKKLLIIILFKPQRGNREAISFAQINYAKQMAATIMESI